MECVDRRKRTPSCLSTRQRYTSQFSAAAGVPLLMARRTNFCLPGPAPTIGYLLAKTETHWHPQCCRRLVRQIKSSEASPYSDYRRQRIAARRNQIRYSVAPWHTYTSIFPHAHAHRNTTYCRYRYTQFTSCLYGQRTQNGSYIPSYLNGGKVSN